MKLLFLAVGFDWSTTANDTMPGIGLIMSIRTIGDRCCREIGRRRAASELNPRVRGWWQWEHTRKVSGPVSDGEGTGGGASPCATFYRTPWHECNSCERIPRRSLSLSVRFPCNTPRESNNALGSARFASPPIVTSSLSLSLSTPHGRHVPDNGREKQGFEANG